MSKLKCLAAPGLSSSFEDSIRKAIYIGGDSDTLAVINGSIAEAFYGGVPEEINAEVYKKPEERLLDVVNRFVKKYVDNSTSP
ncbi:MAG: ADP-ribosylglycohydrolase family protein [Ignavibacterium sp.]|nr:ADP-ribosylglycohydrolase family protein [Ignavibacterium sp.]